jgi:hypothetical protein
MSRECEIISAREPPRAATPITFGAALRFHISSALFFRAKTSLQSSQNMMMCQKERERERERAAVIRTRRRRGTTQQLASALCRKTPQIYYHSVAGQDAAPRSEWKGSYASITRSGMVTGCFKIMYYVKCVTSCQRL